MEKNVAEHSSYTDAYRGTCEWLKGAMDALELCVDSGGDKAAVEERKDTVAVSFCGSLCLWF